MGKSLLHMAVIDDGINEKRYNTGKLMYNIEITSDLKIHKRENYDPFMNSHGTTCAAIIKKYANEALLSSIKVLDTKTCKGLKEQLFMAIKWCANKQIKLINLSLGSTYFMDFHDFIQIIDYANSKGLIVVAACSNKDIYTCPASLNNVIGVKCDRQDALEEGEFIYNCFCPDGIEIRACSCHSIVNYKGVKEFTEISNSFATPMITALIYKFMRDHSEITVDNIKEMLKRNSFNSKVNKRNSFEGKIHDAPVILIEGYDEKIVYKNASSISNLFKQDGYNAVSIVENNMEDIGSNVFSIYNYLKKMNGKLEKNALRIICKVHNPDIVIISRNLSSKSMGLKHIYNKIIPDIKIIVLDEKKQNINKKSLHNCENLIIISKSNMKVNYKTFKYFNIKKLYKYIVHLFEK